MGQTATEVLRHELTGLGDDDILALCYAFSHQRKRARLYLDVLRQRSGERAQFGACLICYDLARQGDVSMQREFLFIAQSIAPLTHKDELAAALVGGNPYLAFMWDLCRAALMAANSPAISDVAAAPSVASGLAAVAPAGADIGATMASPALESLPLLGEAVPGLRHLPLLDDSDFEGALPPADVRLLRQRFDRAVDTFIGAAHGVPAYDTQAGFRAGLPHVQDRTRKLLTMLDSVQDAVPLARGYRALALLFLGLVTPRRSLFGTRHAGRQKAIREGIGEWLRSQAEVRAAAGVLSPMHSDADLWPRLCDLLCHYALWQLQGTPDAPRRWPDYEPPG